MKTKIIALLTAIILTTSVTFAQENKPVPKSIVDAFSNEFKKVSNISWLATDDYYKAVFDANEISMQAFYSFDGKLIAVSRKLTIKQLPIILGDKAKEKVGDIRLYDLFEMFSDRGTEYYLSFEKENKTKIYKSWEDIWVRY